MNGAEHNLLAGMQAAGEQMAALARAITGLPMAAQGRPSDAFVYAPPNFVSIAAGGTDAQTFTVQSDADFLALTLTGEAVDPADEGVRPFNDNPPLTVQVLDQGSGRQLFNRAIRWSNVVGTAQRPYYFGRPKFFKQLTEVTVTLSNNDPTQALRVQVAFGGYKVFPPGTPV